MVERTMGAPRRRQILAAGAGLVLGVVLLGHAAEGVAVPDLTAALGRLGSGEWGLAIFGTAVSHLLDGAARPPRPRLAPHRQ